jgi:hypothetical protein
MSAVYVALFKDGVHSIVHERKCRVLSKEGVQSTVQRWSAGYCPRKECGALFKDEVRGTVQRRSTGAVHGTEHAVHEQSTGCCSRNGARGAVHEQSTGCCSRTEHGVLFTDGARGAVHGRSTGCCSRTEHRVLFTDRAQSVVHGQSTSDDSVPFKIREGKFCQPAKLMPKETGF